MIKPRPLPRLRVQLPFERNFTEAECLRLKRGFVAESMDDCLRADDRWHILFKDPWLHFVRSWTGFCVYKVRLEVSDGGCRIATALANRDKRQYGITDARQDVEILSFLNRPPSIGSGSDHQAVKAFLCHRTAGLRKRDHHVAPCRAVERVGHHPRHQPRRLHPPAPGGVTNTALGDGVAPDMRLMRPDFPYFGEPHPTAASSAKQ
jgi:hypothetical protein